MRGKALPDRAKTEAIPCEAKARPSQLKNASRLPGAEADGMPRGLHPWLSVTFTDVFKVISRSFYLSIFNDVASSRSLSAIAKFSG